ncbi:MAG TPA: superoxide dismutase [Candidatus Moranbacteria bacterium]|nr:superoxide dismutase [Candidatus Moranbacteria bacterium]
MPMYELKNFESILGNGVLSDELLKGHFGLYEGYVKNTNGALDIMKKEEGIYEFGEVSRRFGWEWNGMRLHELYFSNMMKGGSELEKGSDLYKKIEEDFGSYENWEKNFKAKASMRGIGWVILYLDKESGKLFNTWINEHDGGHLSGAEPLLVLDVFEHAFMPAGLKKPDYIEAFFGLICWHVVSGRYNLGK